MTLHKEILDLKLKAQELFDNHRKEVLQIDAEITEDGETHNAYDTLTELVYLTDILSLCYDEEHGLNEEGDYLIPRYGTLTKSQQGLQ